jgi:ligand-binding SRPBCC domain-containing protein
MIKFEKLAGAPKTYRLTSELRVPIPQNDVFVFFSDVHALKRITPPRMRVSILTPDPIEMQQGALIDFGFRVFGLPMRWRSKIAVWEPPVRFVDEQVSGPYRFWRHVHTFEEIGGGTLIRDIVDYRVPLGAIVHNLFVKRDLRRVFEYRSQQLSRIFAAKY